MLHGIQFERRWSTGILFGIAALSVTDVAQAYVGPGLGLSAIGTAFAFIGAIFLAVVGFVWYPIKRLLRRRRPDRQSKKAASRIVSERSPAKSDAEAPTAKKTTQ